MEAYILIEAEMVMNNHSNNRNDEWYTPPEYIESARTVMGGIDLDPASNPVANEHILAGNFYSIENSAFENEWSGKVWMNPPYSRIIKDFISKLVEEYEAGNVTEAIVVTNNGTDTRWFQQLTSVASSICLHRGRIGFLNSEGVRIDNNNKGQVFTYLGNNPERFANEFQKYGRIAIFR